jgi:hypothetical protein
MAQIRTIFELDQKWTKDIIKKERITLEAMIYFVQTHNVS